MHPCDVLLTDDGEMSSIYLSQSTPRWEPQTEADIAAAIAEGLLDETHYLDLKREVLPGRGENRELARDLAQFAIDSGTLLIGVEEVKGSQPTLAPTALDGLAERVEQVARSVVDPPLFVASSAIPSEADPTRGYLLVRVPASAAAPHMVDGAYFGRGDKVRIRLSDAEVRRLHADQNAGIDVVIGELRRYVERDPVDPEMRSQSHLFAVAMPLTPRPDMALSLINGDEAYRLLAALLRRGAAVPNSSDQFSPHLLQGMSFQRRTDGVAMSAGLTNDRQIQQWNTGRFQEDALEVEFSEDGVVRLMTTRFSDEVADEQAVFVTMMPTLVRQLVGVAGALAQEMGYGGVWMLGVAATGIAGRPVHWHDQWAGDSRVAADLEVYERVTSAPTMEMLDRPGPVADRLTGRFVRALGVDHWPTIRAVLD